MNTRGIAALLAATLLASCSGSEMENNDANTPEVNFDEDLRFLERHADTIVLGDSAGGARLAVVPAWQGRVMTSTDGSGMSYGWLNRTLIARGIIPEEQREGLEAHIYIMGGEDRFWIGPEGGQFSWFFEPGTEFDFEHWKVPAFIDTLAWSVTEQDSHRVLLEHRESLQNWSGNQFDMHIEREIVLLDTEAASAAVDTALDDSVQVVAYESRNRVTNSGDTAWTEDSGQPSIWILGMLKHGSKVNVAIPFRQGDTEDLGPIVKDDYFGKVPADRLAVDEDAGVLYFSGDGAYRSKIGVSPERSLAVAGSWDPDRSVLTIVQYNEPPAGSRYVNSSWEYQDEPFRGDAINSYNDGPVDGGILGPFYELETSSHALALAPGENFQHVHRTIHLQGDRASLDTIAKKLLTVSLDQIEAGL